MTIESANRYTENGWQTSGIGFCDVQGVRTGWFGVGGNGTEICEFWLANDKGDIILRPSSGIAKVNDAIIATATPPEKLPLPLEAGIIAAGECVCVEDQFGGFYISFVIKKADGSSFASWENVIATLPYGYYSHSWVYNAGCCLDGNSDYPVFVAVADRNVMIYVTSAGIEQKTVSGQIFFYPS